jgi:hypothetical protein
VVEEVILDHLLADPAVLVEVEPEVLTPVLLGQQEPVQQAKEILEVQVHRAPLRLMELEEAVVLVQQEQMEQDRPVVLVVQDCLHQ